MSMKSTSDRYGTVALMIHWLSAALILALIPMGFAMQSVSGDLRLGLYRVHVLIGALVGVLTLIRILWWRAFDLKPRPSPHHAPLQRQIAKRVHTSFYVAILVLTASGIGLTAKSGLGTMLASGDFSLVAGDLMQHPPRVVHGIMARILIALLVLHVFGAFYHQWIRRDETLGRIFPSNAPRPSSARLVLPRRAAP